jgi:dTMP kinase
MNTLVHDPADGTAQANAHTGAPGRNLLLAFEGCDGAGKTTIRLGVRDELLKRGITSMAVGMHSWLRPAGSRVIVNAREHRQVHTVDDIREAYFADRSCHIGHTVVPALRTSWVIADRYFYSDAVYQEVLYGIPAEHTLARHREAGTHLPDVLVHIDLDSHEAYNRVIKRGRTTRHYEQLPELSEIVKVYYRIFYDAPAPPLPPIVRFVNTTPDWRERINTELLPAVCAAAAQTAAGGNGSAR